MSMTSGQVKKIIETGDEQGATSESTQLALGSGIIAAVLNPKADFSSMPAILRLLGLDVRPTTHSSIEVVDGVTHVVATTDGRTAEDFIRAWEEKYRPTRYAKGIARCAEFTPTTGVTYRIPIIMGDEFSDDNRVTSTIRREAAHDPVLDSDRDLRLLGVNRDEGGRRVCACRGRPDAGWGREDGFAFLAPQA
ncbi:MAG: hypothetical protein UY04_C0031G0012 [Parcubacteria group bacterium GW2011_GWA2_47_7]|nr:MAG: hypothetical protein UY04_C0031G0012 [Parcubacteria group bacterium GW2011_GWA2_47_7]